MSFEALISVPKADLPRGCTFNESDWQALASSWYPVAYSHNVESNPYAATLLDGRVVVYRLSDGSLAAARDICHHRGVPLSIGYVEKDEIICKYHGLRNRKGRCVCIPAHPNGSISSRLRLDMYQMQERYGLVWVQLVKDDQKSLPEMKEWDDPNYLQVLPNSVAINATDGRQMEGFLDVSHFVFVASRIIRLFPIITSLKPSLASLPITSAPSAITHIGTST